MLLNYATDLLHTHQIRRENVFLHKELESCRNELANLQNEMKQIQMVCNSSNVTARKANDLATAHETQLQAQEKLISHLQETIDVLQNDFMTRTKAYDQLHYDEDHQRVELERKIEGLEKGAHEALEAHSQSNAKVMDAVDILRTAIESKADVALVNLLVDRLDSLGSSPRSSPASTSVVYESIEQQEPISSKTYRKYSKVSPQTSTDNAGSPSVQVEDSQKLGRSKTGRGEDVKKFRLEQYNSQRGTTAPEDVDLDANAPTISYAGHYHPALNDPNEGDSLTMLPELNVKASRLAKINTLKQGRYESWDTYYAKGKFLIDSLPQEFEASIIQQFVDGLSEGVRRAQCNQWLENAGWKWESITIFGNLCSQIDDGSRQRELSQTTNESETAIFNDIGRHKFGPSKVKMNNGAPPKPTQPTRHSKWSVMTLRRSRRLIERARRQTNNSISGRPDPTRSRSHLGSKEPFLCNGRQTVASEKTPNSEELHLKGCLGSERQKQEAPKSNSSVEHGEIDSNGAKSPSRQRMTSCISTDRSQGIDISPTTMNLSSSNQAPPPGVLGKRRDRESIKDQVSLHTATLFRVDGSEEGRESHSGTKKRRLPLRAPPELPILSTSSDELSAIKPLCKASRRHCRGRYQ